MSVLLTEVTEQNISAVLSLSVSATQRQYVLSPADILAHAWVHRADNARVHVFQAGAAVVGLALVYDLNEEPACHFMMEFLIDSSHQNKGYAQAALQEILALYSENSCYPMMELSVDRTNLAAIHVYTKAGFADSGYTDPERPQYLNLVYPFLNYTK